MKKILLPHTQLSISKFIFGTASLFNVGLRRQRIKLLKSAIDHGFTHFDTAPYYGFGLAESDLSEVLKDNPHVSVTTKVGIYSAGGEDQSAISVFLRKSIGKIIPTLSAPTISFELNKAQCQLEGSLRRLGREKIDIYMLHEPTFDLVKTDEWKRWLENLVSSGKVGWFGLALTADRLEPFLKNDSPLIQITQVLDSLERKKADVLLKYGKSMQISYGYVSEARREGNPSSVPTVLREALLRNPSGAIIVSTKRCQRLGQYSKISESPDND